MNETLLRAYFDVPKILGAQAEAATKAGRHAPPFHVRRFLLAWDDDTFETTWPVADFHATTLATSWHTNNLHTPTATLPIRTSPCAVLRIRTLPARYGPKAETIATALNSGSLFWENLNVLDSVVLTWPDGTRQEIPLGETQEIVIAGGVPACRIDYVKRTWRWSGGNATQERVYVAWTTTLLEVLESVGSVPLIETPKPGMLTDIGTKYLSFDDSDYEGRPVEVSGANNYLLVFPALRCCRNYTLEATYAALIPGTASVGIYAAVWSGAIPREDYADNYQVRSTSNVLVATLQTELLERPGAESTAHVLANLSPQLAGYDGSWHPVILTSESGTTGTCRYIVGVC